MHATQITATLLKAGFKTGYLLNPPKPDYPPPTVLLDDGVFDPAALESAVLLYCPAVDKNNALAPGNDNWPEDPATGLLTQDVLMIESIHDIVEHGEGCISEMLWDGDYGDVEAAAAEILAIVQQSRTDWLSHEADLRKNGGRTCRGLTDPQGMEYRVSFIGLWSVSGHTDWESGIWEIDSIDWEGQGKVVPL